MRHIDEWYDRSRPKKTDFNTNFLYRQLQNFGNFHTSIPENQYGAIARIWEDIYDRSIKPFCERYFFQIIQDNKIGKPPARPILPEKPGDEEGKRKFRAWEEKVSDMEKEFRSNYLRWDNSITKWMLFYFYPWIRGQTVGITIWVRWTGSSEWWGNLFTVSRGNNGTWQEGPGQGDVPTPSNVRTRRNVTDDEDADDNNGDNDIPANVIDFSNVALATDVKNTLDDLFSIFDDNVGDFTDSNNSSGEIPSRSGNNSSWSSGGSGSSFTRGPTPPPNLSSGFGGVDASAAIFSTDALHTNLFDLSIADGVETSSLMCPGATAGDINTYTVPDYLNFTWATVTESFKVTGSTKREFTRDLSNHINLDISAMGFGAEFKRTFEDRSTEETFHKYMARYDQQYIYKVGFKDSDTAAKHLTTFAQDALENWTAKKIVDNFGTHFTAETTFGGVRIHSFTSDSLDSFKKQELMNAIDLKVRMSIGRNFPSLLPNNINTYRLPSPLAKDPSLEKPTAMLTRRMLKRQNWLK